MPINPMQIMQLIRGGGNPQQLVMNSMKLPQYVTPARVKVH